MAKKIRLGYDILSKRAIETKSGVNIDDALRHMDQDIADIKAQVLSNLAPEYEETTSYQKADWCVHDGNLYTANTDIPYDGTNPNQWDPTQWSTGYAVDHIPVLCVQKFGEGDYRLVGSVPDCANANVAIMYLLIDGYRAYASIGSRIRFNGYMYFQFQSGGSVYSTEWINIELNTYQNPYVITVSSGTTADSILNIAEPWDWSTPYSVGNIVLYMKEVYKCISPESGSQRDWNPNNWTNVTVADLIEPIDSVIPSSASSSNQLVTQAELSAAVSGAFEVVSLTSGSNPVPDVASPSTKVIYLTKEAGSQETDPYTEWIWAAQGTDPETYDWEVIGETTPDLSVFSGSTPGLVPAATAADASKALRGDGTWGDVSTVSVSYDAVNEELHLDFSNGGN